MSPKSSALIGLLFALPFVILNFIVSLHLEPFYSFLASFTVIRNNAFIPLFLLLLFPVGAFIAIHPMLQKGTGAKRKIFIANIILAGVLLTIFLLLFVALGEEVYRCNILKIPNCD